MNNEIQKILDDLYQIDASFKQYEKQLLKIINELIIAKPETLLDESFRQELKVKLISRAEELKKQSSLTGQKTTFNFMTKKIYYLAGALAVIILLVIPTYKMLNKTGSTIVMSGQSFEQLGESAFGPLNSGDNQVLPAPQALGLSGGGGTNMAKSESTTAAADVARPQSGGGGGLSMPPLYWTQYRYIYTGEELNLPAETITVYKKKRGLAVNNDFSSFLSQFKFDNIDFTQFSGAKIQSLNLVEDQPFGLNVYINFEEGSISLSANYLKWPNPYQNCRDENCYEKNLLSIEQIPNDDELLQIAGQFIQKYNINLESFGEPYVNNLWQEQPIVGQPGAMGNTAYAYIPEEITVVYPEMMAGKYIYDSGGNKQGLNIGINIRQRKASNCYNLTAKNFQSSNYPVAAIETILKSANQGGLNRTYDDGSGAIIEVELGAPELAYVKTWLQQPGQNYADEIIAPAYIFPIINPPQGFDHWRKTIIVPLINDLIPTDSGTNPKPMPLMKDSSMINTDPSSLPASDIK